MEAKEKRFSLGISDIIKLIVIVATALSTYYAIQYKVDSLEAKDALRQQEFEQLKREMKDLKDEQQETGKLVSQLIGTTNEINTTVKSIADNIFANQLNGNRQK